MNWASSSQRVICYLKSESRPTKNKALSADGISLAAAPLFIPRRPKIVAAVVKQGVVSCKITESLHTEDGDECPSIRLVSPVLLCPVLERELPLHNGGCFDILRDDFDLEIDDILGCSVIDSSKGLFRFFGLATEKKYTRRVGQPVHQAGLDD